MVQVTFLTRSDCPSSPAIYANLLLALDAINVRVQLEKVDLGGLSADDSRTGYGTPTILVNDADLFGMSEPEPAPPM